MIYTVTFNPSIDYILKVDDFKLGAINRTTFEQVLGGGKGINVSIVLSNLGQPTCATGFIAGFTGEEICRQLDEFNVKHSFIRLPNGFSRINVKIESDVETAINGQGPIINQKFIDKFFVQIKNELQAGDIIVIAGSIPNTLPSDMYEQLLKHIPVDVKVVVDAEKDLLMNCLKFKPFLIKPNNFELGDIFGVEIDDENIFYYAKELQNLGARNVLISLGANGAFMIDEFNQTHKVKSPQGQVVNTVGAGDSMVAGFLTGYIESNDYNYALKFGVATGSASTFTNHLATRAEVETLLKLVIENE